MYEYQCIIIHSNSTENLQLSNGRMAGLAAKGWEFVSMVAAPVMVTGGNYNISHPVAFAMFRKEMQ